MAELEIVIKDNGEIATEIHGIKGNGCENIAKTLESLIGTATKSEKTSDYYKENAVGITTHV